MVKLENWKILTIENLTKIFTKQTGFDYTTYIKPTLTREYKTGYIPFIQNKDFNGKFINYETDYYIPSNIATDFPRILLNEKCLLVSISGSVGNVAVFNNLKTAFIGGAIAIGKFKDKELLDWCMYYLMSREGQSKLLGNVKAGSHQNLILDDLRKIEIPIPPKEEQKAIAKALSDTDELISSLEKLISKKEAIKQGTMQQLLTGKKRLSGFSGEWEEKRLGGIVENSGLVRGPFGGALKKEFFVSKGYKVYEQRNAIYKSIEKGSYFINEDKFQELKRFELSSGDLIVSCSGTIGKIYEIPNNSPKGIINQALLKIKLDNKKIDTKFFLYIFSSNNFQSKIIDNSHGGAMPNLVGMDTFKKTVILTPMLEEQNAISQILSDMDNEIETLKSQLSKTKAIKDGMMSELLTGKTRLLGEKVS